MLLSRMGYMILVVILLQLCACTSKISRTNIAIKQDIADLKNYIITDIEHLVQKDNKISTGVKSNITQLGILPLRTELKIELSGYDSIVRPTVVGLQNAFEQALISALDQKKIKSASIIIHTRRPTTPLCNPSGKALKQTMSVRMRKDQNRSKTIEDRTITLRKLASYGPRVKLHIAYPEKGLSQRSSEEQQIYLGLVDNSDYQSLHDTPLVCTEMPDSIVGASYILKSNSGNALFFSINAVQAIDATSETSWIYWLGSLADHAVYQRYQEVIAFLKECGVQFSD